MKILLLGSGGREHAMAVKISESAGCSGLFIAPGNAGTSQCGKNVSLDIKNFKSIGEFVILNKVELVVVGPEEPLVNGIVDYFLQDPLLKNISVIGPSKKGAELEGSKNFAKEFMKRHSIPTAAYKTFKKEEFKEALEYLKKINPPFVIKADGLAAGKGVVISTSREEAGEAILEILQQSKFGESGDKIVIEEFLSGIELSVFVLTDGQSYKILPEAKDYKKIGEKDTGLNTGGMGAVSPVPFADAVFMKKVEERIIKPTIDGLRKDNIYYKGFVFIGLMNVAGEPHVIEYNVRMGDPETEVVFPRIKSDVLDLLIKTAKGDLKNAEVVISHDTAVTVMVVSGGYPGEYEKGKEVKISKELAGSIIFHAGTKLSNDKVLTSGGRIMAITSFGKTIEEARDKSYLQIEQIHFDKMYYRKDVGLDLMQYQIH
jgi:phosphoribosylamine--glycine ligase